MVEVQVSWCWVGGVQFWLWFVMVKLLIGKGVMLVVSQGCVQINVFNIVNEDCIKVVVVFNNVFYLENLYFIIEGKDMYYFIKIIMFESDLGMLCLISGCKVLENGINVMVLQFIMVVNGRMCRFVDVEMQFGVLVLYVCYGMILDEEKVCILEQVWQCVFVWVWVCEQQCVCDGEEGVCFWMEGEKWQLLSVGKVQGYDGYYVFLVEQYFELVDSVNNIQFLWQSEIGRR